MSRTGAGSRVAEAIHDPGRAFARPGDVLDAPDLSLEDKRRVLEQWRVDAEALSAAEAENMGGGEAPLLARVNEALRALDREAGT